MLGAWGDPRVTGKPAGDDLRMRKKSYPVVWALESGAERDADAARELRRERPALWTLAGPAQAINTGDGMHTLARLAMHRLAESGHAERRVLEAMRELDEGCLRLVEGQYLDISFEQRADVGTGDYLAMAAGKTAAMFAAPFAMGALLGGAEGRVVAAFRELGAHLGIAFQAVDDVLGAWGDPRVTGKPAGDDLRMRKKSYPVVWALESGAERDADAARELARAYAAPPPAERADRRRRGDAPRRAGGARGRPRGRAAPRRRGERRRARRDRLGGRLAGRVVGPRRGGARALPRLRGVGHRPRELSRGLAGGGPIRRCSRAALPRGSRGGARP